jgi:hypothetical protein
MISRDNSRRRVLQCAATSKPAGKNSKGALAELFGFVAEEINRASHVSVGIDRIHTEISNAWEEDRHSCQHEIVEQNCGHCSERNP